MRASSDGEARLAADDVDADVARADGGRPRADGEDVCRGEAPQVPKRLNL